MPHVNLTDQCPCQNGKLFAECCAKTNFKPRYAVTRTKGRKTGISNPRCYASVFRDCSRKISREHFISEGILNILNENNSLTVNGLPWLEPGEERKLNPASLAANILCERHNNALSPLDAIAKRFFQNFMQIEHEFDDIELENIERVFLFNGNDIERWFLKTLCGSIFSKNITVKEKQIIDWTPPVTWLNMLFGTQRFPSNWGIYFSFEIGKPINFLQGISCAAITDETETIIGGSISVKNYEFDLIMTPLHPENQQLNNMTYRPTELVFRTSENSVEKVIVLAYDGPKITNGINIIVKIQT